MDENIHNLFQSDTAFLAAYYLLNVSGRLIALSPYVNT
jgi:hypothetical protein